MDTNLPIVPNHSPRRINYLATRLSPKNYLEIGVSRGSTFLGVNIKRKVAVDPRFRFEFGKYESDSVSFFQVTSDEYSISHAKNEKFDIIFLDGLHTFEQTFRDLCNSLFHCHDRTIWMVDDTYPNDVYSTIIPARKAMQFRKEAGGQGQAWHGDIFKIVFALHDFFPSFSFCTIKTKGNPQTLLWKQARKHFKPLFSDLEVISRLNFFEIKEYNQIFNLVSEEEGLDMVVDAVIK